MGRTMLLLLLVAAGAVLEPGRTIDATLEEGGAWSAPVRVDAPGPVTIEARSLAFDAALELVDAAGHVVARDDDGGIVRDARLVVELRPGQALSARVVAAKGSGGGAFTVQMESGDVPLPGEPEGARRAVQHFEALAAEHRAAGRTEFEAQSLLQAGEISFKVKLEGRGRAAFEAAAALDVPPMQAMAEARLALLANDAGAHDDALTHATRAIDIAVDCGLRDFVVEARLQAATAHEERGEWDLAAATLADALADTRESGNATQRRLVLARRAPLLVRRGTWDQAHASAVEWLTLATNEGERLEALCIRAEADLRLDRVLEARKTFEAVLQLPGAAAKARARATLGLAVTLHLLDDIPRATGVLAAMERDESLEPLWRAQARQLRASYLGMMGRFEEAEEAMEAVLAAYADADADQLAVEARLNFAFLLREAGQVGEAHAMSAQALEEARRLGDAGLVARCQARHAFSSFSTGAVADAVVLARSALERLPETAGASVRLICLEIVARSALRDGRLGEARAVLARATALLETPLWSSFDPDTASRLRAGRRLWNWVEISVDVDLAGLETLSGAARERTVAAALTENGGSKARALRETIADRGGSAPTPTVAELRELLGPGDAVLDFAAGLDRMFVFVLTVDALDAIDLGPRSEVERLVLDLVTLLRQNRSSDLERIARLSSELHARIVAAPLSVLDRAPDRLLVSPIGLLDRLPFEALVAERAPAPKSFSDVTFLVEKTSVVYVPSTPVLWAMARRPPRPAAGAAFLLADPIYCPEAATTSPRQDGPFERLIGTRQEARAILTDLGLEAPMTDRSWEIAEPAATALTGDAAKRRALVGRDDWGRYEVLHLAAHGVADDWNPRQTGLVLAGDELLSVEDVLGLELDAEVTVLSACNSGRGKRRGLDGAQSIALAFLTAGSQSVVSTLWPVDDAAAAELMVSFHRERRKEGVSTAAALRLAQLRWLRADGAAGGASRRGTAPKVESLGAAVGAERRHPFYWAAFVTTGAR